MTAYLKNSPTAPPETSEILMDYIHTQRNRLESEILNLINQFEEQCDRRVHVEAVMVECGGTINGAKWTRSVDVEIKLT